MKDRYVSTGPYFVAYEWADGHIESWCPASLAEAVVMFWQDHRLSQPQHRHISDSTGRLIQVELRNDPVYTFVATAEVMACTKALNPDSSIVDEFLTLLENHAR